jgi:magnesium chelatase family protein
VQAGVPGFLIMVIANQRCPCGHYGDPARACTCPESAVSRYKKRLSGPLLDRIDLHVEVPRVEHEKLSADGLAESTATVRAGGSVVVTQTSLNHVREVATSQDRSVVLTNKRGPGRVRRAGPYGGIADTGKATEKLGPALNKRQELAFGRGSP